MTTPNGGDPGGSFGPRYPTFMDPQNEFGRLTILQMTGKDGADLPVDPYLIGKSVESIVGENGIESAASEQTKRYTLRVRNPAHVEKLLRMKKLIDGTEISIVLHPTLNACKCVISSYDTIRYNEEEVLDKLNTQNVVKVQRITRMENGKRVNSPAIILTFQQTTYPEYVKVGLLRIATRPFYPNPLLCYNCLCYGHSKIRCTAAKRCYNCSAEFHGDDCQLPAHCCHCNDEHRPTNRKCPVFRKETDIIKLKVNNNLTYHEARRRIEEGNATYAQAAAQFRLDTPKLEALLEESKKKDDIIAKLITDNKKKDNTVNKLIEDLKQKAEQLDALTSKIDSLQSVLTSLSKDNQRVSRIPTDRTNSLKLSANTICNKEEKQLRRSKRLQQSSPDNKSPPSKTVKPASSDIELDSIIEYEEEEEECVFYTPDIENTSARNVQSIYPVHDSQPFK